VDAKTTSRWALGALAVAALGGALPLACGAREEGGSGGSGGANAAPSARPAGAFAAEPRVSGPAVVVDMRALSEAERGLPPPARRRTPGLMPVPRSTEGAVMPDIEEELLLPEAPVPRAPPTVGASFPALADDDTAIPPDTMGTVGPSHVFTTLNSQVRVQDRAGNVLSTVSLTNFWAPSGATFPYDPRAVYDTYNQRWVFVAATDPQSANAGLLVGASTGPDPTGTWKLYRLDVDASNQLWLDFPSVGFNKSWIVITGNIYDNANNFLRSGLYIVDKASLYAGVSTLGYTVVNDSTIQDTLSPAETYDNTISTMYLLQMWNGNQGGLGMLRLYTITGAVGAEALTPVSFISTPNPWDSTPPAGGADFAPQLGSARKIQNNDDRLNNTVYRNGKLYTSHNVYLPVGGPTRTAVQWWQVDTSGALLQRGRIEDVTTSKRFYAFPSIAVNKNDDVLIGMSRFSATQYPSANFAFRSVGDPANTMQPDVVMQAGQAAYYKTFGGAMNRWGDYSHTVVDPVDDTALWTIQEYAAPRVGGTSYWATWWTQVIPPASCGADGAPCDDGNPCTQTDACKAGVCVGANPLVCAPLDACHVAGTCDPTSGKCSTPSAADGTACNDGDACTTGDKCTAGVCGGTAVSCLVDACHSAGGVCNPATGACSNQKPDGTACDDGNACTSGEVCKAGVCNAGTAVVCPAADQCHTAGTCNPATGVCSNPAKPDGAACSDGNACTSGDSCKAGVCNAGAAVVCPAPDACHTAGACDPTTGVCSNPAKPDGTTCSDGNACTSGDSCKAGICTAGATVTCPAPDQCHTAGACDPTTGVCSNPAKADGAACRDGNACTSGDVCKAGICSAGAAIDCATTTPCHLNGVCDPTTGLCSDPLAPDGATCSDGDACTVGDMCSAGSCVPGTPVKCPPLGQCSQEGECDKLTGVCAAWPSQPDGTPCDDGNPCTVGDTCLQAACAAGAAVVCPEPPECQINEGCSSLTGACQVALQPDGTPCSVGACLGGVCTGGTTSSSSSSGGGTGGSTTGTTGTTTGGSGPILLYGRGCSCEVPAGDDGGRSTLGLALAALAVGAARRRRR
jgi:MYXO-CTERM domain-containing protein